VLINHGHDVFEIRPGDRIAQLVFAKVEHPIFVVDGELENTDRGEGGFGSTGE
jgi:dUTP pyrophosphatase